MTYGRARLWLGITGVGLMVVIATSALMSGLPRQLLGSDVEFGLGAFAQLSAVVGLFLVTLLPLDFLGGFLLPRKYGKSDQTFGSWLMSFAPAAFVQGTLFVLFGSTIMVLTQSFGLAGAMIAIIAFMLGGTLARNYWVLERRVKSDSASQRKLADALAMVESWQPVVPSTIVVRHNDIGFTGGIIGFGKQAKILIPEAWLSFSTEQIAVAIARRAAAIANGSYQRGVLMAIGWNLGGFLLCSFLPGANLTSVAGLVTTLCGFTLWSFLGLLTLPTISRKASLAVDEELVTQGLSAEMIGNTASRMDQLQDDEPERSPLIETIFHPVPSVASRENKDPVTGFTAWNVARTTLFLSWACLGFLSRSVHCNVGRPELWIMLPTD